MNEGDSDGTLTVAAIANIVLGGAGDDVLNGSAGDDILDGGAGNDALYGGDGNDLLIGGTGSDTLSGGDGDDTLDGGPDADILKGGEGNDTYIIDDAGDVVTDSGGASDTVKASISYQLPTGNALENLILTGTEDIDGSGNSDDNLITGNSGSNILNGLSGNDTLDGGAGADTLIGDSGSDTYIVDDAGDVVVELAGEGTDTVLSSVSGVLADNVENLTLTGNSAISGTGNALNNTLIGNAADNVLDGGAGNDTLQGGAGNDVYRVDGGSDDIVELAGEGTDLVEATVNYTLGLEIENLTVVEGSGATNGTGNASDNILTGNSANNTLSGKDGNDYIDGGAGADSMQGGYGDDTFIVDNTGDTATDVDKKNIGTDTSPIWVYGGTDIVLSSVTFSLSSYVENLTLMGADAVDGTGNGLANTIIGNDASNVLTGNDGEDILDGGLGADTVIGGKGNDTVFVDNPADVVAELSGQGTDSVFSSVTYVLADNVENLTLSGAADINGTGNGSNNILTGNSGINALTGKLGNDTYYVQNSGDVVVELAGEGTDGVFASASFVLSANVENLTLTGAGAINGTGNTLNNTIAGNGAANVLDGGAGNDKLLGGAGDDTYILDSMSDSVTELAGEGTDTVLSAVTIVLGNELENLTLTGTGKINGTGNSLNNLITGNEGNNKLSGGAGNDTLEGGAGTDSLNGGSGDDTYIIVDTTDTITESSGGGNDTVRSSITHTLANNVEYLILTGTSGINGTGNRSNNVLTGNSGNNVLTGLNGNDTLDGGVGADTLIGGSGNDLYVVDDAGDVVTELSGQGTDTVQSYLAYSLGANLENLTLLGTANINGTGNSLNNVITGNAGDNVLNGTGGTDSFYGGSGNDTYVVDSSNDLVTENAGEGSDTVQSTIAYTLGANLENLVLTGTSAINGTGNDLDNWLTGNSANNTLNGGLGNDTLDGGAGTDTLIGGAGNDTYVLGRGYGADTVQENDATVGNTDVGRFLSGIATDQIWFQRSGSNLMVSIIGTSDKLTIQSWYSGSERHLEQFTTADSMTLLDSQVQNLVDAMAAFSPPPPGQTTLPLGYAAALDSVIAANWQ